MKRQQGMSMWGFLGTAIVGVFVLLVGLRLTPAYLEFFSVQRVLGAINRDLDLQTATPQEIRSAFDRRTSVENITVIGPSDLEISKDGNESVVRASYSQKIPLAANISVCLDFDASTAKRK
ncbi:MAG: DUF4845 domain-containing protein [Burkholderiales bacterium]